MTYKSTDFTVGDIIQYTGMFGGEMYGRICIVTDIGRSSVWVRRTSMGSITEHIGSGFHAPISKSQLDFILRQNHDI